MNDVAYEKALITGASAGLGVEFARQIAPKARRLVLVARREDRLLHLCAELMAAHPNLEEIDIRPVDLANETERAGLAHEIAARGDIDLLVNNAGLGDYGEFAHADWAKTAQMLAVNITALTHLAHAVLPGMTARRRGGIINVSSLAGEIFIPDFAAYAATKAYVTRFSEALRMEVKDAGLRVVAVCPGPVPTEFGEVAQRGGEKKKDPPLYRWMYSTAETVAREGLAALEAGRPQVFPSWRVRLAAAGIRALPLPLKRAVLSRRPRRASPNA